MTLALLQDGLRPIATEKVTLRLPVPPSVNNLFVNIKGGRYTSPHYRAWKALAGLELNIQRPRRFGGQVEIVITIAEPKRSRDLDNAQKAILDLLVAHQIIPTDDSTCVRKITAEWSNVEGCIVEIKPYATEKERAG